MSATVTSFWKSTQAVRAATPPSGRRGVGPTAPGCGSAKVSPRTAARADVTAAARSKTPAAAPTLMASCAMRPGRKACSWPSYVSDPPDCECRCTAGFQPSETSTVSHANSRLRPPAPISSALTRRPPRARTGMPPSTSSIPRLRASLPRTPAWVRESTIAAMAQPASCSANAVA